jgi:D-amino-acid oxidase
MSADDEILVIGAGVIGLTTAVCIAEAGLPVRVRTATPPQQSTSRVAGAMWSSSFAEPAASVKRWASIGLHEFRALAESPDNGVRIASGMLASRRSRDPPPPEMFPGVEMSPSSQPPDGFLGAFRARLPLIDMPRYLDYLSERFADAGGVIEVRPLPDPDSASATRILRRCAQIEPRLKDAHIIEHQVGLRPTRPTIRVEREPLGSATLLHNYGHGGSGVSLSWGCARELTEWLLAETGAQP